MAAMKKSKTRDQRAAVPQPLAKSSWRHYTRGREAARRLFVTLRLITVSRSGSRDHRAVRRRRLSVFVCSVNLSRRIEKKRAPTRLPVLFGRGYDFKGRIISTLCSESDSIAKSVAASAAGGKVFVDE